MVGLLADILQHYLEGRELGEAGLIFTRPDGSPLEQTDDSDAWRAALQRAGLPRVGGHSARHTCNTVLTELGVPVDVRRQILGHASNAINEAIYTHTSDTRVAEAMRALSAAMDYRQT
jgi:integrase